MRKRKKGRRLSRTENQRRQLLRTLATSLFLKEKIKTTEARAKELSGFAEKQITLARRGDITSRRFLSRNFSDRVVKKLADEIAPRYKDRKGGYTRIVKLGLRRSDGAKMAMIELVK